MSKQSDRRNRIMDNIQKQLDDLIYKGYSDSCRICGVMKSCKDCKWWEQDGDEEDRHGRFLGWCHRSPPFLKPLIWDGRGVNRWPATPESDWCGEFTQKKSPGPIILQDIGGLSVRAKRTFRRLGVTTLVELRDALAKNDQILYCTPNCGRATIQEITSWLEAKNGNIPSH